MKNENIDSRKCNKYSAKPCGDSHCRDVRIVLNTTFTASRLTASILIEIHGLSNEKKPYNDMDTIRDPGLIVGSDCNLF